MKLVRVTGGLRELVVLPSGRTVETTRDVPFEASDEDARAVLGDKTGRFEAPNQVEAAMLDAPRRAKKGGSE